MIIYLRNHMIRVFISNNLNDLENAMPCAPQDNKKHVTIDRVDDAGWSHVFVMRYDWRFFTIIHRIIH